MNKHVFILGLCLAIAITAILGVRKHFTYNHNQVSATAEVQPEPVTTTQNHTSEEPAPVAQVQGDSATNVVEITFRPKFTFATSPVGKASSK